MSQKSTQNQKNKKIEKISKKEKNRKKIEANEFKNNVFKLTISGIFIFAFGIFIGYQLDHGTISAIHGYLYTALSEATSSNATNSNATDSNATNSNATSSNASANDNVLYLQSFSLGSTSVYNGDKVNVNITTSGACNSSASIIFKNNTTNQTFSVTVNSISDSPYIVIPDNVSAGTYSVNDVLLVGRNGDNTTFTKQYSLTNTGTNISKYNFNNNIEIKSKQSDTTKANAKKQVNLTSISLKSANAKVGDKIYVNYKASDTLQSMKLVLTSNDGKTLTAYAQSLNSNTYIEIPSNTVAGTYTLTSVTIVSSDATSIYSNNNASGTTNFNFNSSLVVESNDSKTYTYNNEDLTEEIINSLYDANTGTKIIINADTNPIINAEVFNAIKGKDKTLAINYNNNQIVFNGKNITTGKSIDVSIVSTIVADNTEISELINDGIVLEFASNGSLPDDALVRIKITDEMKKELGNNKIQVYYYNPSENKFSVIANDVKSTSDDYYEFTISHTSKYVLVSNKIDSELITASDTDDNVVSFQKGNTTNLLLIGIGIVLIIAVVVVIIVVKNKKSISNKDEKDRKVV